MYIFPFILFGSFLEQAGMIRLFTDVALGTVGHTKGGPAKVAVISSALMGTINGSGVANVVTTGQFTIPLMKRFGYRPEFAGAVEATASMGGQIMPPVMGAVAFIMAETLNISYAEVCLAAIVPACLYFATAFWSVHLETGRRGLLGIPKDKCPSAMAAIRRQGYLAIPLAALVYLLFGGYTPLFAGTVGLALTVVLILGSSLSARVAPLLLRVLFWIVLGLLSASFFEFGINVMVALIAALAVGNLFVRGGRETLGIAVRGLVEEARTALPVGVACALVGVIIGTMTLTRLAGVATQAILAFGKDSLFLSLFLTMLVCLVLGMGIPTIPNYIIVSSLVAPVLLKLGVPLIISHMFVFYFGIMADLTPPVALAVFAASAIARSPVLQTGIEAVRVAIAGFVVPYMAALPIQAFTLVWTHSVERTLWREDSRIEDDRLVLVEAAIRGSGAGVDPPIDAALINGEWRYRSKLAPLPRLTLAHSEFATDHMLCAQGRCRPLGELAPHADTGGVALFPCALPAEPEQPGRPAPVDSSHRLKPALASRPQKSHVR